MEEKLMDTMGLLCAGAEDSSQTDTLTEFGRRWR